MWSNTGGLVGDGHATNVDANALTVPACYPDVPGVRQDIADYYGAIQCVDTVFGAVMDELRIKGVLDDTLVIYTSDHGFGLHRAKQSIYGMGLRIPFIVAGAGIVENVRISAPVSHLDVVPTLLDYLGISKPPGMSGSSLMPVLKGETTKVAGRSTVMTTADEKYDGRGVSDGHHYYIRNIRKVSGATLADPEKALNADQICYNIGDYGQQSGAWYNRTYAATLAAGGSVGLKLLTDLVTGNVPDEELYDLDADPACVNDLANDPSLAAVKAKLKTALGEWRRKTGDYNNSPTEMKRRTSRYGNPIMPPCPAAVVVDNFNGRTGNLAAGTDWTTPATGNSGADFTLAGGIVKAPAGPLALSRWGGTGPQDGFSVEVKTGFSGVGVGGGLAFGIVTNGGATGWWQFLLADGRSNPGGAGKDVRLFRVTNGVQANPPLLAENSLAGYSVNNSLYTLRVCGTAGSHIVSLLILDPQGAVYYSNPSFDPGAPVPAGSGFGIATWTSGASIFEDFALSVTPAD